MSDEDRKFEHNAQALLDESVTRVSGRVRSRLNQARHAALASASSWDCSTACGRSPYWPAHCWRVWQQKLHLRRQFSASPLRHAWPCSP